jgi:hypothetical protein
MKEAAVQRSAVLVAALVAGLLVAVLAFKFIPSPTIAVPPASSAVTVVRPLPNVLLAVRDLARLETVSFHMERVIDLSEKQSRLFGLVESEDAILLIAVADVVAGVDLQKIGEGEIQFDAQRKTAKVTLPKAEIFHVALDNEHTYVHTRKTGLLARRQETLESRARAEAERTLTEAAKEAGIQRQAAENARRVVERLVRSLGYEQVEIVGG